MHELIKLYICADCVCPVQPTSSWLDVDLIIIKKKKGRNHTKRRVYWRKKNKNHKNLTIRQCAEQTRREKSETHTTGSDIQLGRNIFYLPFKSVCGDRGVLLGLCRAGLCVCVCRNV